MSRPAMTRRELRAMAKIVKVLEPLDQAARERAMRYIYAMLPKWPEVATLPAPPDPGVGK